MFYDKALLSLILFIIVLIDLSYNLVQTIKHITQFCSLNVNYGWFIIIFKILPSQENHKPQHRHKTYLSSEHVKHHALLNVYPSSDGRDANRLNHNEIFLARHPIICRQWFHHYLNTNYIQYCVYDLWFKIKLNVLGFPFSSSHFFLWESSTNKQ